MFFLPSPLGVRFSAWTVSVLVDGAILAIRIQSGHRRNAGFRTDCTLRQAFLSVPRRRNSPVERHSGFASHSAPERRSQTR